ncbi:phospholipase A [Carnimonas bestiolae]|uniref:phospholipase A n=1 Tax=Carnimonas bestiolae TaxID=3402172 RepID=UPI003EDC9585
MSTSVAPPILPKRLILTARIRLSMNEYRCHRYQHIVSAPEAARATRAAESSLKRGSYPLLALLICASTGPVKHAIADESADVSSQQLSEQALDHAMQLEAESNANPLAISTYRLNYALPIAHDTKKPRMSEYRAAGNKHPEHTEIKYQISLKVNLADNLFHNNGDLFLGYTQFSLWQAYNTRDSAPFRETNYEPELFLRFTNHQNFWGWTNTLNQIGLIHQSNGRGGEENDDTNSASRSWNRIYAEAVFQRGNWTLSLMPWWRIPDSKKHDHNRDIEKYMGYGKVAAIYTTANNHEISLEAKGNPFHGNYGAELDYTFPLTERLRGMVQYYHGYGESMIDYDRKVNRFGLGVSFNPYLPGTAESSRVGRIGSGYDDPALNDGATAVDAVRGQHLSQIDRVRAARSYFEARANENPLSLSTYHRNYILPIASNTDSVDNHDFAVVSPNSHPNHNEVKFQLSIKGRLFHNIWRDNGDIYIAYTQKSWWQAYNSKASSPFRETNYEPELFADFTNGDTWLGWTNITNRFGFVHQSNGRADPISRSWNRLYAEMILVNGPFQASIKPWWRIPESSHSDDNPDIDSYLGYGQLSLTYTHGKQEVSYAVTGNPGKGHFGHQLEYSFPLWHRINGFLQYYNGYGESMIDYDRRVNRIGVGVSFNNIGLGD